MTFTTLLTAFLLLVLSQEPQAKPVEISHAPNPPLQAQPSPEMRITKEIKYAHRRFTRNTRTSLDVYEPAQSPSATTSPRPILLYIHGGGWAIGDKSRVQLKPGWATDQGWVFISINYRLSPRVQHPEHAIDAAEAIAYVIEHAGDWNADPSKLVIMGHSAGAHIAAIVATDESLLAEHDLAPSDLSGVVLLDGAGYDIPALMDSPLLAGKARKMFENAFGDDPQVWIAASPTLQAKKGDTLPPLLAVYAGDRERSRIATANLAKAWNGTTARATIHHAVDKDHAGINKDLGKKNDPDTQVVSKFIYSVLDLGS